MTNRVKEKGLDIYITILLIAAIFEKIQYSFFKLFDLLSIVFIGIVLILGLSRKVVIRDSKIKGLFVSKVFLFFLYIFQGIFIVIDGRAEVFDQYYKGVLVYGVLNTALVLCSIFYLSVYSHITIESLLKKFSIIGSVNIVYNIIQYFYRNIDNLLFKNLLHSNVTRYGTDAYGSGVGRLTGLFTDSNNNAAFLIIYFMVIFTLIKIKGKQDRKKTFLYIVLIITTIELVLTYSRTGWLGISICILFILIKEGLFKNVGLILLGCAGIIIGIYMFQNNFVFNQVMSARLSGLNSNNSHIVAARNVLAIIEQSPIYLIFGVGINCLSVHYEALFGRVGMKAHNLYLQVLCENGILGLISTLFFWFIIFKMVLSASKIDKKYYCLPIAIIGFLIINLTYDSAIQPLYYWVLTLAVVFYRNKILDQYTGELLN